MFNVISWESFLTIISLLVGGYYLITLIAFYRGDIIRWISSSSQSKSVSPTGHEQESTSADDRMGLAQATHQLTSVRANEISTEDIITSGDDEEPETIQRVAHKEDLLIGTVADLLEELKTLIQLIAEYRTGKSESEALFNALFIRYPHLQHTSYPLAVSFYIADAAREQFTFSLTSDEVMTWWGFSHTPRKTNHSNKNL